MTSRFLTDVLDGAARYIPAVSGPTGELPLVDDQFARDSTVSTRPRTRLPSYAE
jgi:hypothetical protein